MRIIHFVIWFLNYHLITIDFVEITKIVEQNSVENHSFLIWFLNYRLIATDLIEMIKIVQQNSDENHSSLMWSFFRWSTVWHFFPNHWNSWIGSFWDSFIWGGDSFWAQLLLFSWRGAKYANKMFVRHNQVPFTLLLQNEVK
jgi:hypothetical protein